MRSILSSIYLSTGILHVCSAIPIPYRYSGQDNVVIIGLLTCIGIGSFMLGVCIFCKKKSGKFKKFKDGDIIQEVISTEYPILKALNALDSSVPCAVVPSSPNNLSTDNLLDKIETYQLAVDHRHDSYCTRRSDPLTSTYDEFDPNDDPDDERSEQRSTAVTATVEQTASAEEPTLLFSDSAFDDAITASDKCNLGQEGAAPVSVPPLPLSSGEDEDEDEECPVTTGVRSDAEDEDERRPLVSDESIDEAVATTTITTTITGTGTTMAHSAEDAISIEEALRALDIAIEGEEEEEEDEEDDHDNDDDGDKNDEQADMVKETKVVAESEEEEEEEELDEGQATPLPEGVGDVCSSSHSLYSEPPSRHDEEEEAAAIRRAEIEQQAAELVDDVLYKCEYMLQMMDANGSTLSPLEAGEFSPRSSRGPASVFDGWGMGLDLDDNVSFAPVDMSDDRDEDWWKDSLEPFGPGGDEMEWNRAGHDPFQDDHTFDLLRQQLTQLLPQANDFGAGNSKTNTDDLTTVSPKASDSGNDANASSSEENEIIINYNRSLSPILEENEDECSLPASTSVAHCSNLLESTILSTEGPVVCEATESVPALLACRRSSLTASNDTLFNLEDVLEDRCYTPLDDATSPFSVASPRSVHVDSANLLVNATNCGLDKLYAFQSRLLATSMASASSTSPTLPFSSTTDTNTISSDDEDNDDGDNDHHLFEHLHHHHHVLLSSLRLQDLDTGDIMESPPAPPSPPPAAARTRTVHSLTIGGGEAKQ
uniref:Putative myelin transcription factor 1 n=1 Tax=Anopheles darlingi TaxID=43151 RepID=A0A2M4CYL3_ANODA